MVGPLQPPEPPLADDVLGLRAPERVLATILFTDLVGSTEALERMGDQAWTRTLDIHHAAVRQELSRFGGEEIDTAGDGFLALFDGPARAIRCALSIGEAVASIGLRVRCGIHTGEVERSAGGPPRGIAVHLAARIAAQAEAAEVFVSATTRDLVAGSGLTFEDLGEVEFKGFEEPRRIFRVLHIDTA